MMNEDIAGSLAIAGGILALALGGTFARNLCYVDSDTLTRLVIGANGLMIAWFGNRMPKTFVPSSHMRQFKRVADWSMVLSGLVYAILWAVAPIPVAVAGGCGAVIVGLAFRLAIACYSVKAKAV
jgi:hypothetical protein